MRVRVFNFSLCFGNEARWRKNGRVEMEGGRYRKTAMRGAHGGVMGNEVRRGRVMACALRGGLL